MTRPPDPKPQPVADGAAGAGSQDWTFKAEELPKIPSVGNASPSGPPPASEAADENDAWSTVAPHEEDEAP